MSERFVSRDQGDLRPAAERTLTPAENLALTVAWAQLSRGEQPSENVSVVCVAALYRITQGGAS